MSQKNMDGLIDFFYEVGSMRRMKRMHSQVLRQSTESLSDHSFQVAIIGLVLAEMEKADSNKVIKMCVLHDLPEIRTGDANYIHKKYVQQKERQAYIDQLSGLPGGKEYVELLDEFNEHETKEAKVANDADCISQLLLQKEYITDKKDLKLWHENIAQWLLTDSGKKLADEIFDRNPLQWVYNFAELTDAEE